MAKTFRTGFLRQRAFWGELVDGRDGVAVLLVDALRADLAHDLGKLLHARGLRVEPHFALAELPTRTEIGMVALLPRAHDDFAVRAEDGRLVASIASTRFLGTDDRTRYLEKTLSQQGRQVCRQEVAEYSDGRRDVVGLSEPIKVGIMGRDTVDEALVLGDEVLIGQTVLEKLDLLVDCTNRKLVPNPAHPDQPVSKVK